MVFPHQGNEEGAQNENTYVYMQSAVKGGEAQLVMRERRVWRSAVELMTTPCDMQLFIVWVIAGIAERVTAHKAMRRLRGLRAMKTV